MNIIIILLLLLIVFRPWRQIENFRNTRGMSYDIRCDERPPITEQIWMNATVIPDPQIKCLQLS
jgi:hypothetical protein